MYNSPFSDRYGSDKMRTIFARRHIVWRQLWVRLANAERRLGLPITTEQVSEMSRAAGSIDYAAVKRYEEKTHHDVMAHILAFADQCPKARPIIHLGATSCYVTDNTDVSLQKQALCLIRQELCEVMSALRAFALSTAAIPTVGYTHLQVAQPVTVGKRATLWLQDLDMDLGALDSQLRDLKFLGCRGATGTAASFLELFEGDVSKVERLEKLIFGDKPVFPVSGQTYTRKQDYNVMNVLCGIAQSASKFANDIRFLSSVKELYEPNDSDQVGSSAMPYKVNPIRCEKMDSLSRYIIGGLQVFAMNTATQFLERTLDDSANRRVLMPEMFLATDEILTTYLSVVKGLYVDRTNIDRHMSENLPKTLEEPTLMQAVLKGEDRQDAHKALRQNKHAVEENPAMVDRLIGLSEKQVMDYLNVEQG